MGKFSPKARREARKTVVQALYQWQLNQDDATSIDAEFRAQRDMATVDVAYFSEAVKYILAHVDELDADIATSSNIDLQVMDPIEHAILWLAVYEFKQRVDLPYRVVINEAVEQAKQFGATDGHKFINGTLDKLAITLRKLEVDAK